ncbi:retrovirus-related pol polyprotein from transposon TNT 1-94 [Tanacetum coccineum]
MKKGLLQRIKQGWLLRAIIKEVYVQQPPGFKSSEFPDYVCKLEKALYGLKQAPRAWYQANPKESHLVVVKRIFRYLKDRKSTSGGCQILGGTLVCWSTKKQSSVAMSSAKAEYVPLFCDKTSAIAISNNPVLLSRTKHIDIRYHFIRDHILKGDIELHFVPTNLQLADNFIKPLAEPNFTRLVAELGMLNIEEHVSDKKKALSFLNGIQRCAYKPLLQFLKNSCISVSLTKQPLAYYSKYLRELWYAAETDMASKTITFTLSHISKTLYFDLDTFSFNVGLKPSDDCVYVPPKETVKADLATLGLVNEDHPSFSSSTLINSSLMKVKYFSPPWKVLMQYIVKCLGGMQGSHDQLNANKQTISYCLCWGLNINITDILFSNLITHLYPETVKKERKPNVCYTRYLSLIMEHLVKDNYKNDDLISLKPYNIIATTFRPTWKNETILTSHMFKVADLSPEPIQSLLLPFREVNVVDTADKSLSGTFVPPVTLPKAQTAKTPKKKKIPSLT